MVTLRKEARTLETPVNPKQTVQHEHSQTTQSEVTSGYEQCRDQRIKENIERMQKLGLFDLSSKLKSEVLSPNRSLKTRRNVKRTPQPSPLERSLSARRSSRLQSSGPVNYSELPEKIKRVKGKRKWKDGDYSGPLVGTGVREEIYTEEHEKLLGTCERTWTLFVDGCGPDGRRVYDQVKGKTCHQCRQKTLGHRTHCSQCELVQGQFCGDCLYMRYGENVLEANQNPDWICPVCRGICNCSLCRSAKGWPATGALYRKIANLGFKSVAHYLIQTRRADTKSGDVAAEKKSGEGTADAKSGDGTDDPVAAKRSLPFASAEEVTEHTDPPNSDDEKQETPNHSIMDKKGNELEGEKEAVGNVKEDKLEGEKADQMNELGDNIVVSATKENSDSIGSRLRQRRNKADKHSDIETQKAETKADVVTEDSAAVKTPSPLEGPATPNGGEGNVASGNGRKRGRKSDVAIELNLDSISGRLRPRRNRVT